MNEDEIKKMLDSARRIAVVGISDRPDRPSHRVARMLMDRYEIVPVNPRIDSWEGLTCYPSLGAIPAHSKPDIVDVFRRSADALPVVEEAVGIGVPYIVLQQGIVNADARRIAQAAGTGYLEDVCLAVLYRDFREKAVLPG